MMSKNTKSWIIEILFMALVIWDRIRKAKEKKENA